MLQFYLYISYIFTIFLIGFKINASIIFLYLEFYLYVVIMQDHELFRLLYLLTVSYASW